MVELSLLEQSQGFEGCVMFKNVFHGLLRRRDFQVARLKKEDKHCESYPFDHGDRMIRFAP
jgi:hypothetical protein